MERNLFKISGPEVTYKIGTARCCRDWPVVTETFTHGSQGLKHGYWSWRNCGFCRTHPILLREG